LRRSRPRSSSGRSFSLRTCSRQRLPAPPMPQALSDILHRTPTCRPHTQLPVVRFWPRVRVRWPLAALQLGRGPNDSVPAPSQTEGQFYPITLPDDHEFDIARNGSAAYDKGQVAWVKVVLTDTKGIPVSGPAARTAATGSVTWRLLPAPG
jgi:hypothetical protein